MTFGERAAELAACAATLLGWRPDEFWRATPAELESALGLPGQADAAMDRLLLDQLLAMFPDKREI